MKRLLARTTSFKNYLNEEFDPTFNEAKFLEECSFYFEQMKGSKLLMLHGTDTDVHAGKKMKFKPRVGPRDSSQSLHDQANDFFEDKFRIPFRDGLFVSGKQSVAREFGKNTAIIVPIGTFEWVMSPDIRDMTGLYDKIASDIPYSTSDTATKRAAESAVVEKLKSARWNHNVNLPKCLAGLEETMVWCPKGFYTFTQLNLPKSVLA